MRRNTERGPGRRRGEAWALLGLLAVLSAPSLATAAAPSLATAPEAGEPTASTARAERAARASPDLGPAPLAGEPRIRLTLRGGRVRELQSLKRLPEGRVRLHLVEGGVLEVDELWILGWSYSPAYLAELAAQDSGLPRHCDPRDSPRIGRWDSLIATKAAEHDLSPELVRAVIAVESCGDPKAVSSAGAVGLMQLMPDTAKWLGCDDRLDPVTNVDAGCRYLRRVLDLFDEDLELGLAAYNAGEGVVARHRRIPPYPETERYVRLVTRELARLSASSQRSGG